MIRLGKRRRWGRMLRTLGIDLATALLVVGGVLYFFVATHAGLLVLCNAAKDYFGSEVEFGAVHGQLAGHFEIEDLRISQANGLHLTISQLKIDWSPVDLLTGQFHLNTVNLKKLSVEHSAPAGRTPKWSGAIPKIPNLPIAGISIDSLTITELEIHDSGGRGVHVDRIHFSGDWEGRSLRIRSLSMQIPGVGPIAIRGNLEGKIGGVRVRSLRLSGPGNMDISGTIGYGASASRLWIRWHNLKWPLTDHRHRDMSHFSGSARIAGDLSSYNYSATGRLSVAGRPITIALSGHGDRRRIRVADIRADAGALGLVTGRAQIAWNVKSRASAELRISRSNLETLIPGLKSRINGQLIISIVRSDSLPRASFALHLEHSTLRGYPLTLDLAGIVNRRKAELTALDAHILGGTLHGKGLVRWSELLTGHLDLLIKNIRPQNLQASVPGHLNGELNISLTTGRRSERKVAFTGVLEHSAIRHTALHLRAVGCVSLQAGHRPKIDLGNLTAELGKTRLSVKGSASRPLDLIGQFQSPDLGVLLPKLEGQLAFNFQLHGSLEKFDLKTMGQGRNLRYGEYRIGRLGWTANLSPIRHSTLRVKMREAAYSGIEFSSGVLNMRGVERHQNIRLRLAAQRGAINLKLAGGYDQRQREWHGKITSLRLSPTRMPAWRLDNKPDIKVGNRRLILGLTCLKSGAGRLCLGIKRATRPPEVKISWSMNDVRLAPLKTLLGEKEEVAGHLRGQGHLQWAHKNIKDARGSLTLSDARLRFGGAPPLNIRLGRFTAMQNHHGTLSGSLHLASPQGTIDAQITLAPGHLLVRRPLTGSVKLNVPHLAFLRPYLTDIKQIDGQVHGAVVFGGTLAHPKVGGQLALIAGRARLNKAGVTLKDVSFHAAGQGTAAVRITGQAASGGGQLRFSGTLDPNQGPFGIDLHVKGKNFQVLDTLDGRVWIDPDLHIRRDSRGIHLTGKIAVPKANLTPRAGVTNHRGVAPTPDQVIVGSRQNKQEGTPAVFANLVVLVGKAVHFEGYGLTTRIAGQVTVNEVPQRLPAAEGRLQLIDGRYSAYGQKLALKKGELIFDGGPITEPAIEILAVRKPREDIEVGVRVRGRLNQPQLSLTSTPPMRRQEQLSWLLFGHPLSENSSANQSAIAGAALALGLSGGNYLAGRIGNTLGIGNLSIGTNNGGGSAVAAQPQAISGAAAEAGSKAMAGSEAAQLTLGKYLTPRLYVSYGVGLFQASQAFRLRYKLGRGLELQTESGVSTGGDLIYTFEGGK